MRVGCADDAEPKRRASHENDLANAVRVPSALNQCIDQSAANDEVGCGGDEPGNSRVEEGVQQVDVEGG